MCLSSSSSSTARSCRQSKDNTLKTPADEVLQRSGSRVDNSPPAELLHVATNTTYSLQTVITSSHYRDDIRLSDLQLMIVCAEYIPSTEHQWPVPVASLSSHKTIWSHNLQIACCWLLLPATTPQHHYTTLAHRPRVGHLFSMNKRNGNIWNGSDLNCVTPLTGTVWDGSHSATGSDAAPGSWC